MGRAVPGAQARRSATHRESRALHAGAARVRARGCRFRHAVDAPGRRHHARPVVQRFCRDRLAVRRGLLPDQPASRVEVVRRQRLPAGDARTDPRTASSRSPGSVCVLKRADARVKRTTDMKRVAVMRLVGVVVAFAGTHAMVTSAPQFMDLFNGKNLKGWVNVNTAEDTWRVKNGVLICSGHPIGVMRSEKPYENFVLHIEWMHIEPGGNSGVFVWSSAQPNPTTRLPDGVE